MKHISIILLFFGSLAFGAGPAKSSLNLDQGTGSIEFHATGHPSSIKIVGKGSAPHGKLTFTDLDVSGETTFDLSSLDTGIEMRNKHMKEKYLEVQKFPQAKLNITHLVFAQPLTENQTLDRVPFTGNLSLHGVEHPVSGTVHLDKKGNKISINAEFSLKIRAFSITEPSFAGISMADEVLINIQSSATLSPL